MGGHLPWYLGIRFLSQVTRPASLDAWADWLWIAVDALVIVGVTALLIMQDLDANGRRFDRLRILFTKPFIVLVLVQSIIVATLFLALLLSGRITLKYGIDALWVGVAGVSLLKTFASGKSQQETQKLWNLADWLFSQFHREIRLIIFAEGDRFRAELLTR